MAYVWPSSNQREFDDNGRLRAARVYFYAAGTTTPLVVYQDNDLSSPHAWPVETSGAKRWPAVFIPFDTAYKVRVETTSGVVIYEQDGLSTPPDLSGEGGGGGDIPTSERWQTGDIKHHYGTGTLSGFVRCNGRTIGSASSGATERANEDCENLFVHLWNADANLSVSGGRGGSAEADWAANKAIAVPNMQGKALVGLEGMGASAANVIQRSTTISTTNASATATVASATGLAIGMYVLSENVPDGTTIAAISGTTVTLSAAATATASGTAARFSFFEDPEALGTDAGSDVHTQAVAEMPSHNHGGVTSTDGSHTHGFTAAFTVTGLPSFGGNPGAASNSTATTVAAGDHAHTIASQGGGLPHLNLPPSMAVTIYMKL